MANPRDSEREKLFTRRALLLGTAKIALFSTLVGRLYYLQVLEADKYKTLADENRINLKLLIPPRGRIVDRYSKPLAVNRLNYRVVLVREQAGDVETTLGKLGRLIEVSEVDHRRVLRDVKRKRAFVPVTVREDLSWEEVARVEFNAPDLPGVSIDVGQSRFYPHTEAVGHILGYVGAVSEAELKAADDPLLEMPDYRIGKSGVEKTHDRVLRGTAGSSQVEVNAVGRIVRELARTEGQVGRDLELTLDIDFQEYARARVGDESAAAVVMDVHTGEVLALVSAPAFDPNIFSVGLNARDWEELLANPKTPLTNKAIAGQYSPGSTFKMTTALAALDAGVITPRTVINCPGHFDVGDTRFNCYKKGGHGSLDLNGALMASCDVYFYTAAKLTGQEKLAAMARRLGFGANLGIDIPGERGGLIPTAEWFKRARNGVWTPGLTVNSGIGQGFILTTPLQLATMTARIANGGFGVVPHLTRRIGTQDAKMSNWPSLGLNAQAIQAMQHAMDSVTNVQGGTGYRARITEAGMEMAGKSGTAQVRRISTAERESARGVRKNEDLPWQLRDHALFVGYAPVQAPRYSCAVVVEHGMAGGAVAGPIVRDLLWEIQKRERDRRENRLAPVAQGPGLKGA